ncbi:hypothetical protein B0H12DRAFT_480898 [Mycena haematopus]|nr:hypothetical protein B0H12DRAFT_480898 [Mycena haematopus]
MKVAVPARMVHDGILTVFVVVLSNLVNSLLTGCRDTDSNLFEGLSTLKRSYRQRRTEELHVQAVVHRSSSPNRCYAYVRSEMTRPNERNE